MESLISFDGASDVMNNLIDKLSDGIGWLATHDTPMRIAIDTYIQDIQNSDFDPVTKAVLISNARKTIKEHRNQSEILKIALQSLSPSTNPQNVDDDWLAQFMDKARLVSDEQFRILWGNVLAEECNNPNSIPKSLLHIMEQMDKTTAEAFMKVAAVSVWYECSDGKLFTPIITGLTLDDFYIDLGITYSDLVELQSFGLIKTDFGIDECRFTLRPDVFPSVIHYHDEEFTIPNETGAFGIGNVAYTNAGQALCRTISTQKIEGFFQSFCVPFWNRISMRIH